MESWAAWTLAGWWALGALLVALLPAGLFALGWQERLHRVAGQTRAFFRFLVDRDLRQQLVARRQALVEELTALASLIDAADAGLDARPR
jgi:hypothetical protein